MNHDTGVMTSVDPLARARFIFAAIAVAMLAGCGGGSAVQAPTAPPPSLEAPAAAPASSEPVAKAMEAIGAKDFAAARDALEGVASEASDDPQAHYRAALQLGALPGGRGRPDAVEKDRGTGIELDGNLAAHV